MINKIKKRDHHISNSIFSLAHQILIPSLSKAVYMKGLQVESLEVFLGKVEADRDRLRDDLLAIKAWHDKMMETSNDLSE